MAVDSAAAGHGSERKRIELMPMESATSFLSRIAALKRAPSVSDFCYDIGLSLADVRLGRPAAIARLAKLGEVDPDQLAYQSCTRLSAIDVRILGFTFPERLLNLRQVRVCPACLRDDFCDGDPRGLRLYGRLQWQLGGFGTCPAHRLALVTLMAADLTLPPMDHHGEFRAALKPILAGDLDQPDPDGGAMEGHLLARLSGTSANPWLDSFPPHAVARFSEVLGVALTFGRAAKRVQLIENGMRRAVVRGFNEMAGGPDCIEAAFRELRMIPGKPQDGPQARYGSLYGWFTGPQGQRPEYDRLRSLFREHILANWPLKSGVTILGHKVIETRVHTVASAAESWGIPARKLRKALAARGLVAPAGTAEMDLVETFPAVEAHNMLEAMSNSLSRPETMKMLGISRTLLQSLETSGMLVPVRPGENVKPRHASAVIEDLLGRLEAKVGGRVDANDETWLSFAKLTSKTKVALPGLLARILDGRIPEVRRADHAIGLAGIRMRQADVAATVDADPEDDRPSRYQVAQRLMTSPDAVNQLVDLGFLTFRQADPPGSYLTKLSFDPEPVEKFDRTYASVHRIAREWGVTLAEGRNRLKRGGAAPAILSLAGNGLFWRWDEFGSGEMRK